MLSFPCSPEELAKFLEDNDLDEYIENLDLLIPKGLKEEQKTKNSIVISDDPSLKWKDITVTMLEHELLFQFKNGGVTRPYELTGFADKRTGGTNSAWEELKKTAEKGFISTTRKDKAMLEKRAGEIRRAFRNLFPGIKGDPVPWDRDRRAWKFAFALRKQPAED